MSTLNKLKYIKASSDKYANLYEELVAMQSVINSISNTDTIAEINNSIANINTTLGNVLNEVNRAMFPYSSIDERFQNLDQYSIQNVFKNLTTSRSYEYNMNGYIVKESVRGDIEYDKIFEYNSSNDIVTEETRLLDGTLIGHKSYTYNDIGYITNISGNNTDDVLLATNSLIEKELSDRIASIEKIDIISLLNGIDAADMKTLMDTLKELYIRVEHLEVYLPGNESSLIDLPNLRDRVTTIENKLNDSYVLYTFNVTTGINEYDVPMEVNEKTSVFLEGLLLDYNDDYTLYGGKIKFNIPLIDDFTITCKYQ